MKRGLICILAFILLSACNEDIDSQIEEISQLVVEGWIEDGGYPTVILTRTLPITKDFRDMDGLKDYLLRWAKVTISDGTDSVVLTGKYDEGYFPPYIYTTTKMKGKSGVKYQLTVEYRNYSATAITTIPSVPDYCIFKVERCSDSDTLFQIKAKFDARPSEKNFYQLFTRVGLSSKQYQASYLGSIDGMAFNKVVEIPVYRGHQLTSDNYTPYFKLNDTVSVKLAHIDEQSYNIWNSYTNTLSLSGNMFLSTSSNMDTNISGGYGYWCGYGSITKHIVIKDSIQLQSW